MQQRPANCGLQAGRRAQSMYTANLAEDGFETVIGRTMCTYDFYEGQCRLDGAFCEYSEKEKLEFLRKIDDVGVVNMEMESLAFAALCTHAGMRGAVICVTLLKRLKGDQITTPKNVMEEWQTRPMQLVAKYMKKKHRY